MSSRFIIMVRGIRTIIVIITSFVCTFFVSGQSDFMSSQYYALPTLYNSAAVGSKEKLNVFADGRLQWTGLPNYPRTAALIADMPLVLSDKRLDVGVLAYYQEAYKNKDISVAAQISHGFKVGEGKLSIGVQPGFVSQRRFREMDSVSLVNDSITKRTRFDLGLGLWYTIQDWWIGLSVQHLTLKPESEPFIRGRSFYLMAGGNIPIKNTLIDIRPSMIYKLCDSESSFQATVLVYWKRLFGFGSGYRYKNSIPIIAALNIKDFYLGYCYDLPTGNLSRNYGGSHELVVGYSTKIDLGGSQRFRRKSIRIM